MAEISSVRIGGISSLEYGVAQELVALFHTTPVSLHQAHRLGWAALAQVAAKVVLMLWKLPWDSGISGRL